VLKIDELRGAKVLEWRGILGSGQCVLVLGWVDALPPCAVLVEVVGRGRLTGERDWNTCVH